MKTVYFPFIIAIMIRWVSHIGAESVAEKNKTIGKLYKVANGYYSENGSWLMNIQTSTANFFPEGTPVLIVKWNQGDKPIVLVGDCLYWIDPAFFEEM